MILEKPLRTSSLVALLALAACQQDVGFGFIDDKITTPPNPPDLSDQLNEDVMRQRIPEEIDVLWVIDNSNSMLAEQRKLGENFDAFMTYYENSGLNWHIGVVSTDMRNDDESGRLQGAAGFRWVDPTVPDPTGVFAQMALLGRDGTANETGRAAVYKALNEPLLSQANQGFYRDDAKLSIIVVSDENDHSNNPTLPDFIDWMIDLKDDPADITFSAIVALETGCPSNGTGADYIEAAEATGGTAYSICQNDWTNILQELGVRAAGLQRVFYLSAIPVPASLNVWIEDEGQIFSFERGPDYIWDETLNAIEFIRYTPRATAEIHAEYDLLSSSF
jgi:hypothetical protein